MRGQKRGQTLLVVNVGRIGHDPACERGKGGVADLGETEEAGGDAEGRDLELEVDGVQLGDRSAEGVADRDHCESNRQKTRSEDQRVEGGETEEE